MDHADGSMGDISNMCGFKDSAAFLSAFKFAFGVTPTEYLHSMSLLFKKNAKS
jgi:AraC-like DNA-binding protein